MHALPPTMSTTTRLDEPESRDVIHSLFETFWMRRRIFGLVFFGVLALIALFTFMTPKSYTSSVKLIAGNPAGSSSTSSASKGDLTNLPILNALMIASGVQTSETYAELFQEDPIAQAVIRDLDLKMSPAALLSHVKVQPVNNTNILSVSVTWNNPQKAATIANGIAKAFIERERDLVSGQANEAIDFLSKQLPVAEKRLREAESALSHFATTHRIADVNAETQGIVAAAAAIDAKMNQAELDREQAQAQINSLSGQLGGMSATTSGGQTVTPNPVLAQLKTQIATAQVQLRIAQQQYTDEHPAVIALKSQISQLQREIARQPATIVAGSNTVANPVYQQLSQQLAMARSQAAGAQAQLGEYKQQRARLDPRIASLPAESAQLANLQRQQKLADAVYIAMQQKYNDAMVTKTTALSDVTITQRADPQSAVVRPDWRLNFAVGFILALVLAISSVLIMDFFDDSIKDDTEVERELAVPVLANVPALPNSSRPVTTEALYLMMEPFLQLVTSMRYASDKPLRTIAITSPLKGDGKSTIALNVGKAFGELTVSLSEHLQAVIALRAAESSAPNAHKAMLAHPGSVAPPRVLLIDADLRRPSLHHKLGLQGRPGLSDVIVGNARLDDVIQPTHFPGLDLLASGTPSPNPIKLLQSLSFDAVLEQAAEKYATVLIDCPAMLPVFDAAVLSAKADGTIMVVSAGRTDLRATKRALQRLDQVGVRDFIGVVMNRSKQTMEDYADYLGPVIGEFKALPAEGQSKPLADDEAAA